MNTGVRAAQAEHSRARILAAATEVFARDGYAGARVEQIARAADANERMLYYYFGSKGGLFVKVLEQVYAAFNAAETAQRFNLAQPRQALEQLVAFVWHYYSEHPEFISLLNTENLHRAAHTQQIEGLGALRGEALGNLAPIIAAGQAAGVFRQGVCLTHTYLLIASLCYFYRSNLHTLTAFLGQPLGTPAACDNWLAYIQEQVWRGLAVQP